LSPILNEISLGLSGYNNNFLSILQSNADLFQHVFCHSTCFHWDFNTITEGFRPVFSEEGSNRKQREVNTYKAFTDFMELCFFEGKNPCKNFVIEF